MLRVPLSWLEWLARRRLWNRPDLLTVDTAETPDEDDLPNGILLREVRGGHQKWVHLRCARCGEHISLPLAGGARWTIGIDLLRRPTISPSIWQTGSCGAHFFVRQGRIIWCAD